MLDELGIAAPAAHSDNADTHGKGAQISELARTTTAIGSEKGAEISAAASGGKSHAGRSHGAGSDESEHGGKGKGKGAEISTLATTTTATGVDKGAEISTAASGGKSHAGEHGGGSSDHGHSDSHATPPRHTGGNGGDHGGGAPS